MVARTRRERKTEHGLDLAEGGNPDIFLFLLQIGGKGLILSHNLVLSELLENYYVTFVN
jgi:hypothetical protein